MENGGKYDGMAAISRRGRRSISSENGGNIERENSNIVESIEETRPNSRGALSTEIPGRLAPLENRLAAVRAVRSAILEAGRAERNKTESISSRFSSLSRGTEGIRERFTCFVVRNPSR